MRCILKIDSELRERKRKREWDGKFMAEMHHGTNIKVGVHTYIVYEEDEKL